ncbi:MAG TPA: biopolymer transporter ExbD [Hyphomicrobiales bacterium]
MGAAVQQGGAARKRRGRRSQPRLMAEITVTPFVDVMLVLLIIFMVTAPLLTVGVPIELPKTDANAAGDAGQKEPLTISVGRDGRVHLQETEITLDEIVPKLTAIAKGGFQETIYIRGDARADYGALMQVMAKISTAGFQRISLVTDVKERN